jgi:peptidoglycan biosynthesis protein MviN/MurJ (putative lipid II flippase)
MVLVDKDILQADATVIAGVLILLTISSLTGRRYSHIGTILTSEKLKLFLAYVAVGIIIPFSISAMTVTLGDMELGKDWMIAGFLYLMIGITVILIKSRRVFLPEGSTNSD